MDFAKLAIHTHASRRLDAAGFVIGEPFDTILRRVSEEWLLACWQTARKLAPWICEEPDLSWGALHSGEAHYDVEFEPHQYFGLLSERLYDMPDARELATRFRDGEGSPLMRFAGCWRTFKWRIAPGDVKTALALFEDFCGGDMTEWSPVDVASRAREEPWIHVARALRANSRKRLDRALDEARAAYSPVGWRILLAGFKAGLGCVGMEHCTLELPES